MKLEAVIEDVVIQPMKIQPIIVNFNNGKLKNEEARKVKCDIYYDGEKEKTVLGLANNQIVYKGYRPNPKDESVYTMLAIHNKKTGKIRLVQAERWDVSPVLNEKPECEDDVDVDRTTKLNKEFGSKRVKRRTELHERMKVNIDSVKEQLEKAAANTEIERADLEIQAPDSLADSNLPPCNRDATVVEDVYNVNDLIPEDKLQALCEKADEILEESLKGKSQFYIKSLKLIENSRQKEKKIAMLQVLTGICTWLNTNVRDWKKKKDTICPFDSGVANFILDTYSMQSSTGRTRPISMRDKAVVHCLILGFMINNFQLDIELFCEHMKIRIGRKKLLDLARIVGALSPKENKNLLTLKLPLPPPPSLIKKGKKT